MPAQGLGEMIGETVKEVHEPRQRPPLSGGDRQLTEPWDMGNRRVLFSRHQRQPSAEDAKVVDHNRRRLAAHRTVAQEA